MDRDISKDTPARSRLSGAALTGDRLDDLYLFAFPGQLQAADEDEASVAQRALQALQACVVGLYGVVRFPRWVRRGCAIVKIDGAKLKSVRERRFISREELAKKVGSHRDHIGRLERGDVTNPHMSTIRKLAEALGVDPAEMVE